MANQTSANGMLKLEDIEELLKAYHAKLIDIEKSQREIKVDNKLGREEYKQLLEELADKRELIKLGTALAKAIECFGAVKDEIARDLQETRKALDGMKTQMQWTSQKISDHQAMFEKPLHKEVHYRHILDNSLWVIVGLVILLGVLGGLLVIRL